MTEEPQELDETPDPFDLIPFAQSNQGQDQDSSYVALPESMSRYSRIPPRVPGLPLIGNGSSILQNPVGFFLKSFRKFGKAFRFSISGTEGIMLVGIEANFLLSHRGEELFKTDKPSGKYYDALARETGSAYFLPALEGDNHKHFRKLLRAGMSREAFAPFIPDSVNFILNRIQNWQEGEVINVRDELNTIVLEILSRSLNRLPVGDHLTSMVAYANHFVASGISFQPTPTGRNQNYQSAKRDVENYLKQLLEHHRQTQQDGRTTSVSPDLIDVILNMTTLEGLHLRDVDAAAMALLPYVNGLLYPVRIIAYMLFAILKHREIADRVLREIDQVFRGTSHESPTKAPDATSLRRMTALRGVYMESLRLCPLTLALPRYSKKAFEFAGYEIPANQQIFIGATLPHYMEEYFPNPTQFDIDRYSDPRNEHQRLGAFAPFGLGHHSCLSAGMVEMICMIVTGTILRQRQLDFASSDYQLRLAIDPVPGPDSAFSIKVGSLRSNNFTRQFEQDEEDQSDQLSLLLPALNSTQLSQISDKVHRKAYMPGTEIIHQGDKADTFYMLVDGEVEITQAVENDSETRESNSVQVIATLGSGSFFGEIGLLFESMRTANVTAKSVVEVLTLDREAFSLIIEESDLTSAEINKLVQRRINGTALIRALPTLTQDQASLLADHATIKKFAEGDVIIQQGDQADCFYILVRGRAEVVNQPVIGEQIPLGWVEVGDYFGETGLLLGKPRMATVRAVENSECLVIDRELFRQFTLDSKTTSEEIAHRMVERLMIAVQGGIKKT